jgi:hypothetical protein
MKLVFINPLGTNFRGENIYEFLFTEEDEIEAGDDWGVCPASSGNVTPPPVDEIDLVGTLKSEVELELAIKSDTFSFNDAIEKIVAIAWQKNHNEHEERLVFHVEDTLEQVENKLYAKDLKLTLQKTKDYDN